MFQLLIRAGYGEPFRLVGVFSRKTVYDTELDYIKQGYKTSLRAI